MRHAYWRQPDGRRYKPNDGKYAPTQILAKIGNTATLNENNEIVWIDTPLLQYESAAFPCIAIIAPDKKELNEHDSNSIVTQATRELIKQLGGQKPIPSSELLKRVERKAKNFFRQPNIDRILVTSISITDASPLPLSVFGYEVQAIDRQNYPYPEVLVKHDCYLSPHIKLSNYLTVGVKTVAASVQHSFDRAMTFLNSVRGIWNLCSTFRRDDWTTYRVPTRQCLGKFHLGPIHTIHNFANPKAVEAWWYEGDYAEDAKCIDMRREWKQLERCHQETVNAIELSPFKDDLINVTARYAIALDQTNQDVSLLMLWGILEKLTGTIGAKYDKTLKRAVWTCKDREIVRQMLNQVRMHRNRYVHSAISLTGRGELCRLLKSIVDELMIFAVHNEFRVQNLDEFAEFLSTPHTPKRLKAMRDRIDRAIELLGVELLDEKQKTDE